MPCDVVSLTFLVALDNHLWRPTILLACLEQGRDGAHLHVVRFP